MEKKRTPALIVCLFEREEGTLCFSDTSDRLYRTSRSKWCLDPHNSFRTMDPGRRSLFDWENFNLTPSCQDSSGHQFTCWSRTYPATRTEWGGKSHETVRCNIMHGKRSQDAGVGTKAGVVGERRTSATLRQPASQRGFERDEKRKPGMLSWWPTERELTAFRGIRTHKLHSSTFFGNSSESAVCL